jgi:hypothetical protein
MELIIYPSVSQNGSVYTFSDLEAGNYKIFQTKIPLSAGQNLEQNFIIIPTR